MRPLLGRLVGRAFDIAGASFGLFMTAPLMLGVAATVRATMGSPVLFKQRRPGLHGDIFTIYKFRTMLQPEQARGTSDADRLTRVGRFLRASSLDELPELLNVLEGSMSLVGPRPLLVEYLERYTPEQQRRHHVKPGITGWAQVNGRNALTWEEKFDLDCWYVDNKSLLLDLRILAMTVVAVLRPRGISHEGEATMPVFMGTRADQASVEYAERQPSEDSERGEPV